MACWVVLLELSTFLQRAALEKKMRQAEEVVLQKKREVVKQAMAKMLEGEDVVSAPVIHLYNHSTWCVCRKFPSTHRKNRDKVTRTIVPVILPNLLCDKSIIPVGFGSRAPPTPACVRQAKERVVAVSSPRRTQSSAAQQSQTHFQFRYVAMFGVCIS